MKVLVTGHRGYIGSVMVPVLLATGHEVTGLDSYFFEDCAFGEDSASVPSLQKDVRDLTRSDVRGFDAIVHLAALCNDSLGDLKPEWTYEINHRASVRLAMLAKETGVSRFLFASSCSMYGATGVEEILTEGAPLRPLTSYAISKVRSEEGLAKLADTWFSPVFMRNATAYGVSPRLRIDLVLNDLVGWAYTTGNVRILSDGTPWRPLVHVEDIANAFAMVLSAPREAIHNQAFNVGVDKENYQIRDLAEIVRETVPGSRVEYAGRGEPDLRNYRVDFSKFARTFPDFESKWNARLGAKQLYFCFRHEGLSLEDFEGRKYRRLGQLQHLLNARRLDSTLRWRGRKRVAELTDQRRKKHAGSGSLFP